MHAVQKNRRESFFGFFALLLALAFVMPGRAMAVEEEAGPGTDFRKCRAQAWADYNSCLMEQPGDTWQEVICYFAWDADNVGCDRALLKALFG